jgi:hypothetical protein
MLANIRSYLKKSGTAKIFLAAVIFLAVVWIYPVPMKHIVLWMDTSESREMAVTAQLQWDDGSGFNGDQEYVNPVVSSEVFVRIPRSAKKKAVSYRLTLQDEDTDITIFDIKLNGDRISLDDFTKYIDSMDGVAVKSTSEGLVLQVTGENPSITFTSDFTRLVRKKWHMANVTRLWLSALCAIGTIWGLIYVKMEDKE